MVWLRDVSVGLRAICRNTPLSIAVALTLVVGVGMNSLVVSLFNGLLFRPAVTRDPSSFVQLHTDCYHLPVVRSYTCPRIPVALRTPIA